MRSNSWDVVTSSGKSFIVMYHDVGSVPFDEYIRTVNSIIATDGTELVTAHIESFKKSND